MIYFFARKAQATTFFIILSISFSIFAEPGLYVSGAAGAKEAQTYFSSGANKISTRYLAYRDMDPWFQKIAGNKALDYGSGLGFSSEFLLMKGFDVIGVDINKDMLDAACYPKQKLLIAKDSDLPFPEKSFDLVFSSLVLFELDSMDRIIHYLDQAKKVLKDDGYFIAATGSIHMYDPSFDSVLRVSDHLENYNAVSGDLVKITGVVARRSHLHILA